MSVAKSVAAANCFSSLNPSDRMKHLVFSHFGLKTDTLSFLLWAPFLVKIFQLKPEQAAREWGHLRGREMILRATQEDEPASCHQTSCTDAGLLGLVPTRWSFKPKTTQVSAGFTSWAKTLRPLPPFYLQCPSLPWICSSLSPHIPASYPLSSRGGGDYSTCTSFYDK